MLLYISNNHLTSAQSRPTYDFAQSEPTSTQSGPTSFLTILTNSLLHNTDQITSTQSQPTSTQSQPTHFYTISTNSLLEDMDQVTSTQSRPTYLCTIQTRVSQSKPEYLIQAVAVHSEHHLTSTQSQPNCCCTIPINLVPHNPNQLTSTQSRSTYFYTIPIN